MEERKSRPANIRPQMPRAQRAKQFAPFESLGSMDEVLQKVIDNMDLKEPLHEQNLEDFNLLLNEYQEQSPD